MKILHLTVGPIGTNCYTPYNETTRESLVVDPGDNAPGIIDAIQSHELRPEAVLLTHAHFDHIYGLNDLVAEYPSLPVLAAEAEKPMIEDTALNCGMGFDRNYHIHVTRYLRDKESFSFAGMTFEALLTPGHTAGSMCYYDAADRILYAGDTIFFESYGRTDLPTGSDSAMASSLRRLLTSLPPETQVLCGHGPLTTIGHEREVEGIGL